MGGKGDEVKGKLKEAAGEATNDEDLRREGKTDQAKGNAKQAGGKAMDAAKDAVDLVRGKK